MHPGVTFIPWLEGGIAEIKKPISFNDPSSLSQESCGTLGSLFMVVIMIYQLLRPDHHQVLRMGNCQASDAATVIVEHPGGKTEKIYWSVSANEVMGSNPGHYVALVTTLSTKKSDSMPQKQLKLLRPEDILHIGHNYRLVSFEEVLMEFSGKTCVKLNKLISLQKVKDSNNEQSREQTHSMSFQGDTLQEDELNIRRGIGGTRLVGRQGQWKPALQSISEVGR